MSKNDILDLIEGDLTDLDSNDGSDPIKANDLNGQVGETFLTNA